MYPGAPFPPGWSHITAHRVPIHQIKDSENPFQMQNILFVLMNFPLFIHNIRPMDIFLQHMKLRRSLPFLRSNYDLHSDAILGESLGIPDSTVARILYALHYTTQSCITIMGAIEMHV